MIRFYPNEIFKKIEIEYTLKLNYAISNYGRLVSYTKEISEGRELYGGKSEGFKVFSFSVIIDGKRKHITYQYSRLVAKYFIDNDDVISKKFVIHLDHNKLNDKVENLQWATQKEVTAHNKNNPLVIIGRQKTIQHNLKSDGRKLTSTQVIRIKKMFKRDDNKTRLTLIAKQLNVSTQQLWRIKTGENWSHIEV